MQKTPFVQHDFIPLDPDFPIRCPPEGCMHSPCTQFDGRMHYHDSLEIGLCCRGSGLFYIGGRVHSFSEGDVSVIAPGVPHIAQSAGDDVSSWLFLSMDPAALLGRTHDALLKASGRFTGILPADEDGGMGWLVRRLTDCCRPDALFGRESAVWLTGLMMTVLAGRAQADRDALSEGLGEVSAAVVYISTHYDEHLTVEHLASLCSRSVTSFRRYFESATGKTPFEYLYEVRIKAAVNLLKGSDMSVSEIAGRVGYPTLSSFNRHFRRITGRTPSQLRREASAPGHIPT